MWKYFVQKTVFIYKMEIKRNYRGWRIGESHSKARLSDEEVNKIRRMYKRGIVGYKLLAAEFNSKESTIRDIVKGYTR